MKVVSEYIDVKCSECGKKHSIDTDCLDEDVIYIGEGGMGEKYLHSFISEMNCVCGNEMRVRYSIYEYPINSLDYKTDDSEGCSVTSSFIAEFDDEYIDELVPVYYQILMNPELMYALSSRDFEEFVADVFRKHGFDAYVTQATRDGGRDVVATCSLGGVQYTTYFECKNYSIDNPVGVTIVRSLYGVLERDRIEKGVIVTTSRFTRAAIEEASQYKGRIQLIDFDKLVKIMQK